MFQTLFYGQWKVKALNQVENKRWGEEQTHLVSVFFCWFICIRDVCGDWDGIVAEIAIVAIATIVIRSSAVPMKKKYNRQSLRNVADNVGEIQSLKQMKYDCQNINA